MIRQHKLVVIFYLLFCFICSAQNYKKVDSIVSLYPPSYNSVNKLAEQIGLDFSNDFERVRAIYTWLGNNIIYDLSERAKHHFEYSTKSEFENKEKKYDRKLASRAISQGKAVCEGYSILFTAICEKLNIKSEVVIGSSKTLTKHIGRRFHPDHAWNIVTLNDEDYLIDATWGAKKGNSGVNYFYFLTDPELFIKKHYPNDYENALLMKKIEQEAFLNGPIVYNYNFKLIEPINGILKKSEINTVKFKFATDKKVTNIQYKIGRKEHELSDYKNNEFLEFEIDLKGLKAERELVLYFDLEPVIGFKLK